MSNNTSLQNDLPADLAKPARRALDSAGITRLEQIATYTENQLKRLHGIGPNAIEQLRRSLADRGLAFAEEIPPEEPS
jgi:hypothetical protein